MKREFEIQELVKFFRGGVTTLQQKCQTLKYDGKTSEGGLPFAYSAFCQSPFMDSRRTLLS
jgi:hypothetical protein